MSHLRQGRATLTRDNGSRVKVASVTGLVARCVMARRTVARLVFGIERCSILCDFDARQSHASNTRDKIAGVTSILRWRCPRCSISAPIFFAEFRTCQATGMSKIAVMWQASGGKTEMTNLWLPRYIKSGRHRHVTLHATHWTPWLLQRSQSCPRHVLDVPTAVTRQRSWRVRWK